MKKVRIWPVIELLAAAALIATSILTFGWASLGWWQPNDKDHAPALSSLTLYTNNPKAVVSAILGFGRDNEGDVTANLLLNLAASEDPAGFRWALVGRDDLVFNAEMETLNDDGSIGEPGQLVERELKEVPPAKLSRSCETGTMASNDETIIVGGLGGARLVGTNGVESVDPGSMVTILHFPRLQPMRSGEEYSLSLGYVGAPDDGDPAQLGPLLLERVPTCIDLGGSDDVGNAGRLTTQKVNWSINIPPEDPSDTLISANPAPDHSRAASWEFTDGIQPEAVFSDNGLKQVHQAALFFGGLLAGVGTNYLVQGLTGLRATRQRLKCAVRE
ncbi:MAG: hypothetical protein WBA97_20335 [Actinophytocola sp.]|uniref:hypothetical protein n=1 Tax=Actinophytocola sp. TaxID=1872138 RepID=UPI003C780699